MKILRLPAYYFPERISSSHLTKDLEKAYVESGFEVEVYAPVPTRGISDEEYEQYKKIKYEEFYDGKIKLHRFSLGREKRNPISRAVRYARSNFKQYRRGKKADAVDIITGGSTPPTQGMLCAKVAKKLSKKYKKKVPFVDIIQDVFPDSLVTTGLAKKNSLAYKIGTKIANYTYRHADAIIVISEDMKKNLLDKGVPEEKLHVIYNWINTDEVKPVPKEENKLYDELGLNKDTFKIVYAGNLGLAQGVDTLLDAAELLSDEENIEFVIFGKGAEEARLKKRAENMKNVSFFPLMPMERVPEVYSLGDACVVLCKKGTGGAGVPSKTWSIMACGTPIIASFDTDSELARIISSSNSGVCVEPDSGEVLAEAIKELAKGEKVYDGGRNYVENNASAKLCTQKYVDLLKEFCNS